MMFPGQNVEQGLLNHAQAGKYDLSRIIREIQSKRSDDLDQIMHLLTNSGFVPRLPGITKIISQLSKYGSWQKALLVYKLAPALGITPDTALANSAISAADKGGDWQTAQKIFNEMDNINLTRDAITYSSLISAMAKGRQWEKALAAYKHMQDAKVPMDEVTFSSLITALEKGGQIELAEQVFYTLYKGHPQFDRLVEVLDDGSGQYTSVSKYSNDKRSTSASWLNSIVDVDLQVSESILDGQYILYQINSLVQQGLGGQKQNPTYPYPLKRNCISHKKEAPNRVCCNSLLTGYCNCNPPMWQKAIKLLGLMLECGGEVEPDVVSYNNVIKACCIAGKIGQALVMFTNMVTYSKVLPTAATYNNLMGSTIQVEKWDIVIQLWACLERQQMAPHQLTTSANYYLKALMKLSYYDSASNLYTKMISKGIPAKANCETIELGRTIMRNTQGSAQDLLNLNLNSEPHLANLISQASLINSQLQPRYPVLNDVPLPYSYLPNNLDLLEMRGGQQGHYHNNDVLELLNNMAAPASMFPKGR